MHGARTLLARNLCHTRPACRHAQLADVRLSWASPRAISWLFLASDIFCLMIQSTGAALTSSVESYQTAKGLLLVGLALQLAFFALFGLLCGYVGRQSTLRHQQQAPAAPGAGVSQDSVRKMVWVLYSTIGLLTIRNAYRFAEFAQGFDGPIAASEPAFYMLDSVLILATFVIFSAYHPGRLMPELATLGTATTGEAGGAAGGAAAVGAQQVAAVEQKKGAGGAFDMEVGGGEEDTEAAAATSSDRVLAFRTVPLN